MTMNLEQKQTEMRARQKPPSKRVILLLASERIQKADISNDEFLRRANFVERNSKGSWNRKRRKSQQEPTIDELVLEMEREDLKRRSDANRKRLDEERKQNAGYQ